MALQAFVDSSAGTGPATTLHAVGAIAMLAALGGYWSWTRHLRHGQHQVAVLQVSAAAGYLAIAANLLGGFMRTYQSDHPSLTLVAENAWVQVLLAKHLILFTGMGAFVWLFERTAPRLIAEHRAGRRKGLPRLRHGHHGATWIAASSILVASVLGAVAQVTPIGAMDTPAPPPADDDGSAARSYRFGGQLTADPLTGGEASGGFDVGTGADGIEAVLTWQPDAFDLRLVLTGPDGDEVLAAGADGRAEAVVDALAAGTWSYAVQADAAIQVEWTLVVLVRDSGAVVADSIALAPGTFHEINTEMEEGAGFRWAWEAEARVHFDVHSHFDGEVQYHEEMAAEAHEGDFTNDRAGGYSLLWYNGGDDPVRITYHVSGDFRLHSIVGP